MRKTVFKKFIANLEADDLRNELENLFDQYKDIKKHYAMELGSEAERKKIYDRAKKNIESKYASRSYRKPRRPRINKVNIILKEMAKISIFKQEMADLYLFNAETALHFMEEYYYFSEPLVNSIFNSFSTACGLIQADLVEHEFRERCLVIVEKAWDVNEYLGQAMQASYAEVFS